MNPAWPGASAPDAGGAIRMLQRIRQPVARPKPGEVCELCGEPVADQHSHLVDVAKRSLLCACRPCALLFSNAGAAGGRYRLVPDDCRSVPSLALSPGQWEQLQLPVSVAFFFYNSQLGRVVAFYPSPAGATESLLPLDLWDDLVAANPVLATIAPDVEALLARVRRGYPAEYYLVPIDICYELVGHLRLLWKGFDGGQEARAQLDDFFERVRSRSLTVNPDGSHA